MIVTLSRYRVNLAEQFARDEGCDVLFSVDRQGGYGPFERRWQAAVDDGRFAFVDLRMYAQQPSYPRWITRYGGHHRRSLARTRSARADCFAALNEVFDSGPLLAPSADVDDVSGSLARAAEWAALRDRSSPGRPIYASVAISRSGLRNNSVLAQFRVPVSLQGISLTVVDVQAYPSTWTQDEWFRWLRLVGTLIRAGQSVILPYSDLRGLVALGLAGAGSGRVDYSTGCPQADRQTSLSSSSSGGGGATAPVTYLSAPLLSLLHGEYLAFDDAAREAGETHRGCSPFGTLAGVPQRADAFDTEWAAAGSGVGDKIAVRLGRYLSDSLAIERWVRRDPGTRMERLLAHAAEAGDSVSADLFRGSGSQRELEPRLNAFRAARQALSA